MAVEVVRDDEALHLDLLHQEHAHQLRAAIRARRQARGVVLRDQAAQRDARVRVEQRHDRIPHRAADVLEVHVDALRARVLEQLRHARVAMIDAGVEAELLHGVVALLLAAGDADRAQPFDLRDLPDDRADGAGRRGDDQRLAGLRLADVERADVRGQPGHAEHAERIRGPRDARIELDDARAVRHLVLLPAAVRRAPGRLP